MTKALLTLNAGSSSLKFRLFGLTRDLPFLVGGKISDIGGAAVFQAHWQETSRDESHALPAHSNADDALAYLLNWLESQSTAWQIVPCAHRIVHGGPDLDGAAELDVRLMAYLRALSPLAPLHQPHNLAAVDALKALHPDLRQFGCFDTAFHAHHEPLVTAFALPARIREQGVRRYGFHGLSYSWIARRLGEAYPGLAKGRVVAAHLGNGASLCALKAGQSVDTTMGLTALDGLPMGTRCGALDPGAVLFMQDGLGLTSDDVQHMLYEQSGLLGLSGVSNDVKTLLASPEPAAAFAIDYFAYRTAQQVAAMAVSLGGMDGLIFTGGIGENAEAVRSKIQSHLAFLPRFETQVIPANEERAMALEILDRFYGDAP